MIEGLSAGRLAPVHGSGVIWVTGFSGSGKTTVGRKLDARLKSQGYNTIFLDGDELRSIFSGRWGYERHERIELAKVYFRLCSHLAAQGFVVVISAVAMYDEVREWLKNNVPNSVEAYLNVPVDIRLERDRRTKNVYAKSGNMELMYDAPKAPDVTVENFGDTNPESAAETILSYYMSGAGERDADRGKGKHWNAFYTQAAAPIEETPFARSVAEKLDSGRALLEVGCGNGRDSAFFLRHGHDVTSIDPSTAAIDFCQETYKEAADRFLLGKSSRLLPEYRGRFSVLYSRFVVHSMTPDEEDEFLDHAVELLAPNGEMHLEFRSINDPMALLGEVISPTERIHGHYRRFIVLDDFMAKLKARGLKVIEAIESNGLAVFRDEDPVVIRIHALRQGI